MWIDLNTERGYNTRSKSLLELCGLEHRISQEGIADITEADWCNADIFLISEKVSAEELLKRI